MVATIVPLKDYAGMEIILKADLRPPHFMAGTKCIIQKASFDGGNTVIVDLRSGEHEVFCHLSDILP